MPRRPRLVLPEIPLHLIQRGNNRQICFVTDDDCRFYLECLGEYAETTGCRIHAYVLMSNHVHLLVTPESAGAVGALMKRLGQRYVQYFNRTWKRSGTLWEGRFRSCLAQDEAYVLACYRYIELNPVRAGMVEHPDQYRWSSYDANAQGADSRLLIPHADYLALGSSPETRRRAYRELFRCQLDSGLVDEIRGATNGNYVLGNDRFRKQVEVALQQRTTRGRPGRPRKKGSVESGEPL